MDHYPVEFQLTMWQAKHLTSFLNASHGLLFAVIRFHGSCRGKHLFL